MDSERRGLPRFWRTAHGWDAGNLALVATVVAAFVSTIAFPSSLRALPGHTAVLLAGGALYLALGLLADEFGRRLGRTRGAALYFAIQIPLGLVLILLARGEGFLSLILFPLVGQAAATLPRWAAVLVCGAIFAGFFSSIGLLAGWATGLRAGVTFLPGIIFVAFITNVAARAERARGQVERLAADLAAANERLRAHALNVEELATTQERNRIAREIHDGLGHYLTGINVQIEAARAVLESDRARALTALDRAQTLARDGLGEVRRSVAALRGSPLDGRPLTETVERLVDECLAGGHVATLRVVGAPRRLAAAAEHTLYRAVQEGLTNARRHARASRVDVTLEYGADDAVRVLVLDNGVGIDPAAPAGAGFGLLGVRERAQQLGGRTSVESVPGGGVALTVEVPG